MNSTSDSRAVQHRLCGFGIFLLVLGIAGYGGIQIGEARVKQVATWPSVAGRIVTSEVTTATVKTGRVLQVSPIAKTEYTFSVDGRSYKGEGRRVIPMLHFEPEGTPEAIVKRYPVGSAVKVYYDPNNPKDALLTPKPAEDARSLMSTFTLIAPVIGFVGLVVVVIAVVNLRSMPRNVPARAQPAQAIVETPRVLAVEEPPAQYAPPRRTHFLVRGAATICGLFLFLFGSLTFVTTIRLVIPGVNPGVQITMLVIFGLVTLFGGFLVCVGMKRPKISAQSV